MNTSSYYTLGIWVPLTLPVAFTSTHTHLDVLHTHTGRDWEGGPNIIH